MMMIITLKKECPFANYLFGFIKSFLYLYFDQQKIAKLIIIENTTAKGLKENDKKNLYKNSVQSL